MQKVSDPVAVAKWKQMRQRCRTNLGYLCYMLSYKDVVPEVHGEMVWHLQRFQGGVDGELADIMRGCGYTPAVPMWELPGPRRRLILVPRGHLKTSICTAAHTIQWIINYPDVRVLISTGTGDQMVNFLTEIKQHFQFNRAFRQLFPEFCPSAKNVKDFGTQERFTVPCRGRVTTDRLLREPTVSTCSVDKVTAGGHYDVIKHDDLQDEIGARTPGRIDTIKRHYGEMGPLLETSPIPPHHGWEDIIGTVYDYSDLHYSIYESEMEKPAVERKYSILLRSAAPNYPEGPVMWPNRVPLEALRAIEQDPARGPAVLYPQYLMNPIVGTQGLCDKDAIAWVPAKVMREEIYPRLNLRLRIDLAGMRPRSTKSKDDRADNDYTAITLSGFLGGVLYVPMIWHGRFTPEEVIEILFKIVCDHPRLGDIRIEKGPQYDVLQPFLKREMARRNIWFVVGEIPRKGIPKRDKTRIGGLQPWFQQAAIRFSDDIPCRFHIITEITRYPKYEHDDILDTLVDSMKDSQGGVTSDVLPREGEQFDSTTVEPPSFEQLFGIGQQEEPDAVSDITGW